MSGSLNHGDSVLSFYCLLERRIRISHFSLVLSVFVLLPSPPEYQFVSMLQNLRDNNLIFLLVLLTGKSGTPFPKIMCGELVLNFSQIPRFTFTLILYGINNFARTRESNRRMKARKIMPPSEN